MKLFSYPAGAKVGGQELSERTTLPAQAFEVNEVQYGPEVLALWTTGLLAQIGVKPVVEDPVELDYDPGPPVDVDEGFIVYRTYPNAVFSQVLYDARRRAGIRAQIAELEAMMTPRLIREAMMGKTCTVNKPGCCIDGLTPAAALETIDTRVAELRSQLAEAVYYQAPKA